METANVTFDDFLFDATVHGRPPEGGDLEFIVKDKATVDEMPGVCIAFSAKLDDGKVVKVQAVTTARIIVALAAALEGRVRAMGRSF